MVARGQLRQDLYYRLAGVSLVVPPLRERVEEIPKLATDFVARFCAEAHRPHHPDRRPGDGGPQELPVAGQRAGAAQRHRARGGVLQGHGDRSRAPRPAARQALAAARPSLGARRAAAGVRAAAATAALWREHRVRCHAVRRAALQRASGIAGDRPHARADAQSSWLDHGVGSGSLPHEMEALERQRILDALAKCGGNQTQAAEMLGISRRTLLRRLDDYAVPRPRK